MAPCGSRHWPLVLSLLTLLTASPHKTLAQETTTPGRQRSWAITAGAAPGYIDDRACAGCHSALYRSYHEGVSMARSFGRPQDAEPIESFGVEFVHERSQRHYVIERNESGELLFRRFMVDPRGQPIHAVEIPIDWVLGSGKRARTYLYGNPAGELFLLPLAWYSQTESAHSLSGVTGSWGMAPGFDQRRHLGVHRPVVRACLFCHNAYPDVRAGSDRATPDVFPNELPNGIGCQRCHGPGADHVQRARAGEALGGSIVNPKTLTSERSQDICRQCHLQPTVAIPRPRRLGRGDYSYVPGEPLSDYLLAIDIVEPPSNEEPFEINHHPYRLEQSRCYQESKGALTCLTCHDPHRAVAPSEAVSHFRSRCLGCHDVDEIPRLHESSNPGDWRAADCVGCHMPKRRPRDVVQVVMTDHKIQRRGNDAWLATREESDPIVEDLRLLYPDQVPHGEGKLLRLAAAVGQGAGLEAVKRLAETVARLRPADLRIAHQLTQGWLHAQKYPEALAALDAATGDLADRHSPLTGELRAVAWVGVGEAEKAIETLEALVLETTESGGKPTPVAFYNLGRILAGVGRDAEALERLEQAVSLRPSFYQAWKTLGDTHRARGQLTRAEDDYRQALAYDPVLAAPLASLIELLASSGQRDEARRQLAFAIATTDEPDRFWDLADRLGLTSCCQKPSPSPPQR